MIEKLSILYYYFLAKYFLRFESRTKLESYQNKKLHLLRTKSFRKSKFYRKYTDSSYADIPIMTKDCMMVNFNDINTLNIDKDKAMSLALQAERTRDFSSSLNGITVGLSSGTSGNRGLFIVKPSERAAWTGVFLAKILPSSIFKNHKISLFLRSNSELYETIGKSKRIQFKFHDLKHEFNQLINEVNLFKPTILIAPAQVLRQLAISKTKGKLYIQPLKVYSCAEVLNDDDKHIINHAFNLPVHEIYQCTEGFIGITCDAGTMHLNEEFIYCERKYINDDKKRFIPIITDFTRSTQLIVRYQLNDILIASDSTCACGSAAATIEGIEGRCDDIVLFPDFKQPQRLKMIFPDYIRRALISNESSVSEYRVTQNSVNSLDVEILTTNIETDIIAIKQAIYTLCSEFNCATPDIKFKEYRQTNHLMKRRRVIRTFPLPDNLI